MFNEDDLRMINEAHLLSVRADAIEDMKAPEWRACIDKQHDLLDQIARKMATWPDADLEAGLLALPSGFHRSELRVILTSRSLGGVPDGP